MTRDAGARTCPPSSASKPSPKSPWYCWTWPGSGACRSRPWWSTRAMRTIRTCLSGLDERQVPYVCAVQSTFGVRLPDEVRAAKEHLPTYGGRGQPRKPRPAPLYSVKELIEAQPEDAWQTIGWREGTKGTMQAQVLALRVHWATGSQ